MIQAFRFVAFLSIGFGSIVCHVGFASDGVVTADEDAYPARQLACDGCGCGQNEACGCYGVDTDPGHPKKPCIKMPGDRSRSDNPPLRYRIDDDRRAGHPDKVAPWAICGRPNTFFGRYTAWFVGGGSACADIPTLPIQILPRGRGRMANGCGCHGEGTWGLDYEGFAGHAKVWLKYTAGRKQGGEGAYETDGEPKLIAKAKELLHPGSH